MNAAETALTITNPLVLYRALVATQKIKPDAAQHRLAIHLQKLYHRLKDYEPQIEYRHRLGHLSGVLASASKASSRTVSYNDGYSFPGWGKRAHRDSLALVRTLTSHDSALSIQSPQGILIYGAVGTGKSMLVDLLAESLPNRKKRRWHFNTFMLETFTRLEQLRAQRALSDSAYVLEEHSLLSLARDMIMTSPILFLDEFQLPDKASSKILSSLFTSFFHLGGVLVATSNRMPEELAKASGIEFVPPSISDSVFSGLRNSLFGRAEAQQQNKRAQQSDFAAFLEVLKARCEAWDMEGEQDWRRVETGNAPLKDGEGEPMNNLNNQTANDDLPRHYIVVSGSHNMAASDFKEAVLRLIPGNIDSLASIPWESRELRVYGRILAVPRSLGGVTFWKFSELCARNLGPADYITLASTFNTFVITEVPVLSLLQKNEARRFITLLDALYEARVKLLITAEAGPDDIFFPETTSIDGASQEGAYKPGESPDGTYAETFSEIYQDQMSPFRPNISSYTSSASTPDYAAQPLPNIVHSRSISAGNPNPTTRSILADEDSDFGPVYGAGRSSGVSFFRDNSLHGYEHDQIADDLSKDTSTAAPDFQRSSMFTGEDERFAYKRARSRLWEMCSQRWWERQGDGWWKPLSKEARPWENGRNAGLAAKDTSKNHSSEISFEDRSSKETIVDVFPHGGSPFRTSPDPPPKISWVHTWGMMRWGRRAGIWGKGAERFEESKQGGEEQGEQLGTQTSK